jgi:phosphoribosylamine--glycine ligase
VEVIDGIINEKTDDINIEWDDKFCVSVVAVSGGYPMKYSNNKKISGLDKITNSEDVNVFHARTDMKGDDLVTVGGRVLNVVVLSDTLENTQKKVYEEIEKIHFQDIYFRSDIAKNILKNIEKEG